MKIRNILLCLLCFISFNITSYATAVEPDYDVVASYISAEVDILGSMHVKEAIIIKGSLNGFIRELVYKNSILTDDWVNDGVNFYGSSFYAARGLDLSKVSAKEITKEDIGWNVLNLNFAEFEEVDYANSGDNSVYTVSPLEYGIEITSFNQNTSGYMVYYFDYYVNQVTVLHNDVAEIYYTFFKLDEDVQNVNIQLTLPGSSTTDTFRFWAHGALNGEISAIKTSTNDEGKDLYKGVVATLDDYKSGDDVEIRITFDKGLVSAFSAFLNNSKVDALESIIKVETERAEEANSLRIIIKSIYYTTLFLGIAYLIGLILLWIRMYKKYDKEYKVDFNLHYYRDFTGDYNVEVVDYLMNKKISTNAFNASLMNLIYKKNVEVEEIPDDKKNLTLILKSQENVTSAEAILLDLLFKTIGQNDKVTLKEIEKYSSKYSTAEAFMKRYDAWAKEVLNDANKEEFFEEHNSPRTLASLYFILGLILFLMNKNSHFLLAIIILISSIAFCIYVWSFKKWSKKGREHYLKWKAFKNFLTDFGSLKDKEIPEIKLWEKYLVYATVFGIAKEVQKAMKVRLTDMGLSETEYMPTFNYYNYSMFNMINSSMSNAISKSSNMVSSANAHSSMSSGSGFGGGFSSGGGFSGGGGGGGRGF